MIAENEPLQFQMIQIDDGFAYDVRVVSEEASVGDYIRLLDRFLDETVAPCFGCDNCCSQRIPLTLPDLYTYAGKDPEEIRVFLKEKCEVVCQGRVVDVKLAQRSDRSCIFLDREKKCCSDHLHRSLVCHSYICIPQTERARLLRETLINKGEDALIGSLCRWGVIDASFAGSYPPEPGWEGKDFEEILLKEVLPLSVFEDLL